MLVEAAEFDPVSIRNTARQLNLHSDSSYRFERRVDPEGLDWASRRCCELILELAGGELAAGVVDVGQPPPRREPIVLRLAQLKRILGIDVPAERVREILVALGNEESQRHAVRQRSDLPNRNRNPNPRPLAPRPSSLTVVPPSWRRDLTREIDLIEEVARIHGYEAIPEDVSVPMAPSARRREDRVLEKIRHVLTAAGFDEALTLSVVDEQTSAPLSPWTDAEPLRSQMPVIRGADCLRRSLVPSLLGRAADQRGAGQRGDRAVRDRQGLSAARRRVAAGRAHAGHHQRPGLSGRQRRDRGDPGRAEDRGCRWRPATPTSRCSIRRPPAACGFATKCSATWAS